MQTYLTFDLGGTFIKYALMQEDSTIVESGKVPSKTDCLESVLASLEEVAVKYPGRFAAVAISMPGRINTKEGIAYTGGAYRFIHDLPFAKAVEERLGVPVKIANDGKCAASAEAWNGALADVNNGAVIVLGTATGGGIVLNHEVYMGSTGGAGELSNFIMDMHHYFDATGSLYEKFNLIWAGNTSATGLLMKYAVKKGLDVWKLNGLQFFEAYDSGDSDAIEALEEFAKITAVGIFSLQSVLDLERYAIGGGISARMEITDKIREKVDELFEKNPGAPFGKPEIVRCKYGNDANMIGALKFYLNDLSEE
ncbi:MAG: ROK family protein [Erysipelotrichaceae bacterium]|nr:ROK family protein [Erysipelotrichaceae bacterium]